MIFVIDTSVAVKWFINEPGHEAAKRIILSAEKLVAPELAYAEVGNVLWRKVRLGEIEFEQARTAIVELPTYVSFEGCREAVMSLALELAQLFRHSVYDCIFLAMTLRFDHAVLVTDDERFASKAAANGYSDKLRKLRDEPIGLAFDEAQLREFRRLFDLSKRTFDFVASKIGEPIGDGGLRVYASGDLKPAYESPAYVTLKQEIAALSPHQAGALLALCWLGRGHDGSDFNRLYGHAAHLSASPEQHAPYIISLIGYLDRGIIAYRQTIGLVEDEE